MADDCCLHSQLRQVWEQGWREQLREIEDLNDRLDHVDGHDGKSSGLDLVTLWQESANVTDRAARITRARHLTQDLMRFWRFATPANDHLDPRTTSEMEREPMSHAVALTERRRQLVRHAKAGLVEYRIFGEVLARDDGVLDSLPSTELASLEDVWRQLGAISNVTGLAAQAPKENELDDDVHVNATRWLAREDILARIDNGTAPWQRWWVLPPVQRVGTFLVRCWAAYVAGVLDPRLGASIDSQGNSVVEDDVDATPWMALLGETLRASASNRFGGQESNLFPLLLMMLPIARLGHIEAAAIYVIARMLGSLNTEAMAASEGFGATAYPDRDLSVIENYNTEQTIINELLALFDRYFASYSVETYALYAVGSIPLLLVALVWWLSSELLGAAVELVMPLMAAPSADPFFVDYWQV